METNWLKIRFPVIIMGVYCFFVIAVIGCSATNNIPFEEYVDTTTRPIATQQKQTYHLETAGVYTSSTFDGARLNGFEQVNDSTALVVIKPENAPINNSPYYAFNTWATAPKNFYFTFHYPEGFKHRYWPKIKKGDGWQPLDSAQVFKQDTIFTILLALDTKPTYVAAQELNTSADVVHWYTDLAEKHRNMVHVSSVGESHKGTDQPVLNIHNGGFKGKSLIVLLTRQHPPEVTGYLAFQSFLTALLANEKIGEFLEKYAIIAFPIMNPDGVDMGHWRHNAGGIDLNRDWSKYNQPEIRQAVEYINRTVKKNDASLVLGLDFHSTWYDVYYTNPDQSGTKLPGFEQLWFRAIENGIPDYEVNEAPGISKRPTSKGWFLKAHNAVGITYEIGDSTPRDFIEQKGKVSAEEMIKVLLENFQ